MVSDTLQSFFFYLSDVPTWKTFRGKKVQKNTSHNLKKMIKLIPLFNEDMKLGVHGSSPALDHVIRAMCYWAKEDLLDPMDNKATELNRLSGLWRKIHEDPANNWSVDKLATESNISKGHLHRCCKRIYGIGPQAMVTQIRLEYGAALLLSSDQTIEIIALQSGFGCARSFSQAFLRKYAIRPGKYRVNE
jgi:AraC-like DNA-binding protein